eukprot:TRINITY_DN4211_c0_g1_i1.p1 TRINITY_DN4211_c0_g1~~TRINITY_DN4211_c0_g1_i1.p1  ORF type:complete len:1097 (-),score=260.76 TRINITY_DN4211_c0_g1_i1:80-3370(-)
MSSKKRILNCRVRGEKVLQILESKKSTVDVGEFTTTIKFLISVLSEYLDTKGSYRPQCNAESKHLEAIMIEYSEFLEELIQIGRFLRFFTSNRVRKRLDHINTQIYKDATEIYLELQQKAKSAKKGANVKKNKEVSPYTAELEKLSACFRDDEARVFWENNFEQAFMISWDRFIAALKQSIQLDPSSAQHLQYILDNSNTGSISMSRFSDFLNGFGPLKQCVEKVESILNAEWFHGFLSSTETERLLEKQPSGTFLIRFSKSKPGSFAIGYVEGDPGQKTKVTHTLIACAPPSGFKIEEAYNRNARGRLFATLFEVVDFYNYLLKYTFRSDLSRLSWFHGDLTSQEADELLSNAENGSYLVRFSTTPGFLAVSYVREKNVKHALLECLPNGYRYDNKPHVYKTLTEMVNDLSDTLKHPCSNLTYELNPAFQKQVVFNGTDGEAMLAPVAPKNAPGSGIYGSLSELKSHHPPTTPAATFPTGIPNGIPNGASNGNPAVSSYGEVDLASLHLEDPAKLPAQAPKPLPNPQQYQVPVSNYMSIPESNRAGVAVPAPFTAAPGGNYGNIGAANLSQPAISNGGPGGNYGSIGVPQQKTVSDQTSNGNYGNIGAINFSQPPANAPTENYGNFGSLVSPQASANTVPAPLPTGAPGGNYGNIGALNLQLGTPIAAPGGNYGTLPSPGLPNTSPVAPQIPTYGMPSSEKQSPPSSNYGTIPSPLTNSVSSPPAVLPNGLLTNSLAASGNYGSLPSPGLPAMISPGVSNPPPALLPGLPGLPPINPANLSSISLPSGPSNLPPTAASGNYGSIPSTGLPTTSTTSLSYSMANLSALGIPQYVPSSPNPNLPNYPSMNNASPVLASPTAPQPAAQSNYGTIPFSTGLAPAPVHSPYIAGSTLPNNALPTNVAPANGNYGVIPTAGSSAALPTNYPNLPNTSTQPSAASLPSSQYGSIPTSALSSAMSPNRLPSTSLPISPTAQTQSNYGSIPTIVSVGKQPTSPAAQSNYGSIPTGGFGALGGRPTLVSSMGAPSSPIVQKARTATLSSPVSGTDNYGQIPSPSGKKDKKEKKSKDPKISSPPSPANYGSIPTSLMKTPPASKKS